MPSPFLLSNLFSSVGLLCPEVPQNGCAASLFAHLSAGGAGRMLVLGGCYCSTPTSSHSLLWAGLLGASGGGWSHRERRVSGWCHTGVTHPSGGSQVPAAGRAWQPAVGKAGGSVRSSATGLPRQLKDGLRSPSRPAVVLSSRWEGSQLLEVTT